jgi:hypothetical protein
LYLQKPTPPVKSTIAKPQPDKEAADSSSDSDSDVPSKSKPISMAIVKTVVPKVGTTKRAHESDSDSSDGDDDVAPPPAKVGHFKMSIHFFFTETVSTDDR